MAEEVLVGDTLRADSGLACQIGRTCWVRVLGSRSEMDRWARLGCGLGFARVARVCLEVVYGPGTTRTVRTSPSRAHFGSDTGWAHRARPNSQF